MIVLVVTFVAVLALAGLGLLVLAADDRTRLPTRYHWNAFILLWFLAVVVGMVGLALGAGS